MNHLKAYTLALATTVAFVISAPVSAQTPPKDSTTDYNWDLKGDGRVTGGTVPDKSSKCSCTYQTQVKVGNTTHTFHFICTNVPIVEVPTPVGPMYTCIGACPDPDQDADAKPGKKKPYDCGDAFEVRTPPDVPPPPRYSYDPLGIMMPGF